MNNKIDMEITNDEMDVLCQMPEDTNYHPRVKVVKPYKHNSKVQPIKPSEVDKQKSENIPDEVFEAFNELIVKNFSGGRAIVKQKDVISLIIEKTRSEESSMVNWYPEKIKKNIYDNHWFDIEDIYRENGWTVVWDKPVFNETYEASWTFTKNKKGNL